MSSDEEDFRVDQPSVLGTKDFWDQQYQTELENFLDHGDIGEIWFGKRVMDTIVTYIDGKINRESASILDLGCGNGVLLIHLARKGFRRLTGVDYVSSAIKLARTIATARQVDINYETLDVLADPSPSQSTMGQSKFDVVLDKGTFDAITLMENFGAEIRERYLTTLANMLIDRGLFVIATCNWTQEEITQHMESCFDLVEVLPTPSMQFGGQQGRCVTVIVFQRK